MKYLVIGDAGFIGRAFCEHLISAGQTVLGEDLSPTNEGRWERVYLDINDVDAGFSIVERFKPDVVVNFAAGWGGLSRSEYFKINCLAILDLIEKCVAAGSTKNIRFVLIGSAAEYGIPFGKKKLTETDPLNPITDYGIVKSCQTYFANNLVKKHNAGIIVARPFNLIGPALRSSLFLGHCALQVVKIEQGSQENVLRVGNLESYRDMLSLSKAVEMIYQVSQLGKEGQTYNICSGQAVKMQELLDKLLGYAKQGIKVETEQDLVRKHDPSYVVGDNSKYLRLVGKNEFIDEFGLDRAVKATLDWHRSNS